MFKVTTITVIVNPCQVTEIKGFSSPAELTIPVSNQQIDTFKLDFTQIPSCGYAEEVQIAPSLPEFI